MTESLSSQGARRLVDSAGASLTIKDLARTLNVSTRTAHRMLHDGRLPEPDVRVGQRVMRWFPATLERFLNGGGG